MINRRNSTSYLFVQQCSRGQSGRLIRFSRQTTEHNYNILKHRHPRQVAQSHLIQKTQEHWTQHNSRSQNKFIVLWGRRDQPWIMIVATLNVSVGMNYNVRSDLSGVKFNFLVAPSCYYASFNWITRTRLLCLCRDDNCCGGGRGPDVDGGRLVFEKVARESSFCGSSLKWIFIIIC